ncbi:MAG: hypothetical protein ACRDIB_16725 [Ardenticatenaceae bacterium]
MRGCGFPRAMTASFSSVHLPDGRHQRRATWPATIPAEAKRCAAELPRDRRERGAFRQGRFEHLPHVKCNADMGVAEIRQFCRIETERQLLLKAAMRQMQLSARAYHRAGTLWVKLARTIADLDGKPVIGTAHVAEALQYRRRGVGWGNRSGSAVGRAADRPLQPVVRWRLSHHRWTRYEMCVTSSVPDTLSGCSVMF